VKECKFHAIHDQFDRSPAPAFIWNLRGHCVAGDLATVHLLKEEPKRRRVCVFPPLHVAKNTIPRMCELL